MSPVSAAAPCRLLDWDTRWFGLRVGRITEPCVTPALQAQADQWCRQERIQCLYLLADADDAGTVRVAEASGFQLMDIRVTLEHARREAVCRAAGIRAAQPGDVPVLRAIAAESHAGTRFYADGRFPRERVTALYQQWIEQDCAGQADLALVAERDGRPAGYLTGYGADRRIGLVGVDAGYRGAGIGGDLVRAALAWFEEQGGRQPVSVVTQGRNVAAQRLYQRCGFLTRTVQLWYHKWYS
ncbi:MAG: GNAT family N-acetyltransferase [Candidatus Omnitrophica bacterium]|nr:GNAT family N-acetyltransferase [Candidatus Omnitrophota bacterium]